MKALLLFPSVYTLNQLFQNGFEKNGFDVKSVNYSDIVNIFEQKIDSKTSGLQTWRFRKSWSSYYIKKINEGYIRTFEKEKPSIVFIYNNQYVLPETVRFFKKKGAFTAVFLGDSPLFSPTFDFNLTLLFEVDQVVSPDTYWVEQLQQIGLKSCYFDHIGFNPDEDEIIFPSQVEREIYNNDIVFIGGSYMNAWGYRRALFYKQFAGMNMKIYGDVNWLKWLKFFPELQPHFVLKKNYFNHKQTTTIMKCAKVYPVDANPGLVNGLHIRIFDCLAASVLPLLEYRKDLEIVFPNIELPLIKNFENASIVADYYIKNDKIRKEKVDSLRKIVISNYTPYFFVKRLLQKSQIID